MGHYEYIQQHLQAEQPVIDAKLFSDRRKVKAQLLELSSHISCAVVPKGPQRQGIISPVEAGVVEIFLDYRILILTI